MILRNLRLSNFRRFRDIEIDFHSQLTVIVARNGQGKTSILDAATIALGTFIGAFDLGKAKHIERSDARYMQATDFPEGEQQFPVQVIAKFDEPQLDILRELTGPKNKTTIKDAYRLTEYGRQLQQMVRDLRQEPLPVIAYYGAGRLWKAHKNMERKQVISESRTLGYEDCLSPASNFVQVQQWMAKATLAKLQRQELPEYQRGMDIGIRIKAIQDAVNHVLKLAGWRDFHYSFSHEELAMFHPDHGVLPVSLLSDGVRAMVSLVADLAFRCVRLNGFMGEAAPRLSQGIVFIDEVDIHLHPEWQQQVIRSLREAFQHLQFIVTTHSPQVLTTIPACSIRVIDGGGIHGAPPGTEGAEASRLLKRVFGVDVRPPNNEATKELNDYLTLVYANKWDTDEAVNIRKSLDARYQGEEPALTAADLYIENCKWEKSIEQNEEE